MRCALLPLVHKCAPVKTGTRFRMLSRRVANRPVERCILPAVSCPLTCSVPDSKPKRGRLAVLVHCAGDEAGKASASDLPSHAFRGGGGGAVAKERRESNTSSIITTFSSPPHTPQQIRLRTHQRWLCPHIDFVLACAPSGRLLPSLFLPSVQLQLHRPLVISSCLSGAARHD